MVAAASPWWSSLEYTALFLIVTSVQPSQDAAGCGWLLLASLVGCCPNATPAHELHPVALQAHEPQVEALQAEVQTALSQAAADGASWNRKVMELKVSCFRLHRSGCCAVAVRVATTPDCSARGPHFSYFGTAAGSVPTSRAELCWTWAFGGEQQAQAEQASLAELQSSGSGLSLCV